VATGVPAAAYAAPATTVMCCMSKGLCAPVGSLLAGPADVMAAARGERQRLGGGMRQAGVIAAAGLVALHTMVERLADDHARARRLGEALADAGVPVSLEQVETNFVQVDAAPLGLTRAEAMARMKEAGVLLSTTVWPTKLRAVTHLDVDDDDIERAVELAPGALLSRAAA